MRKNVRIKSVALVLVRLALCVSVPLVFPGIDGISLEIIDAFLEIIFVFLSDS